MKKIIRLSKNIQGAIIIGLFLSLQFAMVMPRLYPSMMIAGVIICVINLALIGLSFIFLKGKFMFSIRRKLDYSFSILIFGGGHLIVVKGFLPWWYGLLVLGSLVFLVVYSFWKISE